MALTPYEAALSLLNQANQALKRAREYYVLEGEDYDEMVAITGTSLATEQRLSRLMLKTEDHS